MSLRQADLRVGNLRGTIYTFEKTGDVLAWHTHGPETAHITVVARGQMRMDIGHDGGDGMIVDQSYELAEGHCIDTGADVHHQFVALTDNARIYNIIKEPEL